MKTSIKTRYGAALRGAHGGARGWYSRETDRRTPRLTTPPPPPLLLLLLLLLLWESGQMTCWLPAFLSWAKYSRTGRLQIRRRGSFVLAHSLSWATRPGGMGS